MIPVNLPLLGDREREYVLDCLETGWISSEGPYVRRFEGEMAAACNRKFGVAVANGTVAIEVALAALGVGPGDEVITPAFTIVSCAASVVRRGAVPVLVDSDALTWNVRASEIEARISPRTRAIIVAHTYGLPAEMDDILAVAGAHGIPVLEDAAEMHGQTYRGRPCGSFGALSTFSFYANKHVTTGEGGMLLTDDEALAEHCRSLRNLCFGREERFVHEELGWNFRMTNIQAALGCAQLERLGASVARKREIGALYNQLLEGLEGIERAPDVTDYARNVYWVYGLVLAESTGLSAKAAMAGLRELGVDARPFFWPMHEQPVFRRMGLFADDSHPVAERLGRQGLYLPSGLGLTDEQVGICSRAFRSLLE